MRAPTGTTWREYLTAATPTSRRHATVQRVYLAWVPFSRNPTAIVGLVIVALVVAVAMFAPWLASHSPIAQDLSYRLAPSTAAHWLGTDELGRDIYSRLVWGTRTVLRVIFLVAVITGPIGLIVGAAAGYVGGWWDAALMRITDIFLAFPRLILALALTSALGPGIDNAIIAIGLTGWPPLARLARAETLTIRSSDFIAAARVVGASASRIVFRHVMPLCMPSLIVRLTLDMAGVILIAAGLGFLGLGAQPPQPEWGAMIASGRKFVFDQWWIAAYPGIAICILSLGFNLFGDGLRDALDPKAST
ncbi:MAG: ABC transporter permease [Rhodospirillales bacterium]|nr:ABC transporter permease [Rhodospirillales bacterium]